MSGIDNTPLDLWMDEQALVSAEKLALAISATSLVKHRPEFVQTVRPTKGSVLAAPQTETADDEPDYFFHWLRDSAIVMDVGRVLIRRGISQDAWSARFHEFVEFSLALGGIKGRSFVLGQKRDQVAPEVRKYLRSDDEIAGVEGDRVMGEVRYNADGTLDFLQWSRPQHDGPALRALAALRFWELGPPTDPEAARRLAELIQHDLDYTCRHAGAPGYDIWEEAFGKHYYTTLAQFAALRRGARWMHREGRGETADVLSLAAEQLVPLLASFWSGDHNFYRSRLVEGPDDTARGPDMAVIFGVLHAGLDDDEHSIRDQKVHATLKALEELFATEYAINRSSEGVAFGRYKGDRYFSGGAYYFSTFAAAEVYYRCAALNKDSAAAFVAKGDHVMSAVRKFVPRSGELSEQFDGTTGAQTSARNLSWSYASFITAWDARKNVITGRTYP